MVRKNIVWTICTLALHVRFLNLRFLVCEGGGTVANSEPHTSQLLVLGHAASFQCGQKSNATALTQQNQVGPSAEVARDACADMLFSATRSWRQVYRSVPEHTRAANTRQINDTCIFLSETSQCFHQTNIGQPIPKCRAQETDEATMDVDTSLLFSAKRQTNFKEDDRLRNEDAEKRWTRDVICSIPTVPTDNALTVWKSSVRKLRHCCWLHEDQCQWLQEETGPLRRP